MIFSPLFSPGLHRSRGRCQIMLGLLVPIVAFLIIDGRDYAIECPEGQLPQVLFL
jgi:hypothetical protein